MFLLTDDPIPDDGILEFIRQNFGDKIRGPMKDTIFQRRTIIRQLDSSELDYIPKIVEIMPRLFDMDGMVSLM